MKEPRTKTQYAYLYNPLPYPDGPRNFLDIRLIIEIESKMNQSSRRLEEIDVEGVFPLLVSLGLYSQLAVRSVSKKFNPRGLGL